MFCGSGSLVSSGIPQKPLCLRFERLVPTLKRNVFTVQVLKRKPLVAAGGDAESHTTISTELRSEEPGKPLSTGEELPGEQTAPAKEQPTSIFARMKRFILGDKLDKERIAALGLGAVASYGFLSNLVYCTGMAVTWVIFVKQNNISPLAAGQWPKYLAFYAGFWTINNFIRPFRFAVSVAMAPVFDRIIDSISKVTGMRKRGAFGVYVFVLGIVTSVLTFGSIAVFGGPAAYAR